MEINAIVGVPNEYRLKKENKVNKHDHICFLFGDAGGTKSSHDTKLRLWMETEEKCAQQRIIELWTKIKSLVPESTR